MKKLTKKDFTKEGMLKLIHREIEDLNGISDEELMCIFSFFKFLIAETPKDDEKAFMTNRHSIVAKFKDRLEATKIKIVFIEEVMAG